MLKKTEHLWKSIIHDGDTVSVHRPNFYANRFQKFMRDKVFRKMPAPPTLRLVNIYTELRPVSLEVGSGNCGRV